MKIVDKILRDPCVFFRGGAHLILEQPHGVTTLSFTPIVNIWGVYLQELNVYVQQKFYRYIRIGKICH